MAATRLVRLTEFLITQGHDVRVVTVAHQDFPRTLTVKIDTESDLDLGMVKRQLDMFDARVTLPDRGSGPWM